MKKTGKILLYLLLCLIYLGCSSIYLVNQHVKTIGEKRFLSVESAGKLTDIDCILVFGCQVSKDGIPSPMLSDRLFRAIEVYRTGVAPKLLMSGDHGRKDYDEVTAMKHYATQRGVPPEDVFLDHAGFSTYETLYRAKEIFGAKKVLLVTQSYHLSRALYIAQQLGLDAYGVPSDLDTYGGQLRYDAREVLARCKDFVFCLFRPKPTYLGTPISLAGDGNQTNAP